MSTIEILWKVGIGMLALPMIGWFFYVIFSGMVLDYKYAKFRDKVDKTDFQARRQVYFMLFILWALIAFACAMTACVLSEINRQA